MEQTTIAECSGVGLRVRLAPIVPDQTEQATTTIAECSGVGSDATGPLFVEGDCVARRWPARGDQPSSAMPSRRFQRIW